MNIPAPLHEIPAADIADVRASLVTQADEVLGRAEGAELAGDDATEFRSIEAAISTLDMRARLLNRNTGHIDPSRVLPNIGEGTRTSGTSSMPRVAFAEDAIRELHDAFMSHRAATISADTENRTVTAPPMATVSDYRLEPLPFRREPTRIADLCQVQNVTNVSVTYYQQTTAASAAATVAEGAAKPESNPGWTAVTTPVRKIAHYTDVSKESLDDFANFQRVVRDEMVRGLINAENLQVLSGDGTGTNLTGLLTASGILTYAPGAAEARYVSLVHAMTLLRNGTSFAEPDVIVLNPADWETFQLSNATTAGLHAVMDNDTTGRGALAAGAPSRNAWGVPVVLSSQITSGVAMVANLSDGAIVFSREPATVFVDPYSQSKNNLVRFIAEERLALGVQRPTAILKTTFNGAA